ncbi:hypothetical protein BKA56DRAFT_534779 [Ilyonectria sp. MPI-CAGE-AT-0026]|nr:hypothetical protein BKA56DRAFT_534779 [Ilyonectria sp. MPI-CAGE-AT-0026]
MIFVSEPMATGPKEVITQHNEQPKGPPEAPPKEAQQPEDQAHDEATSEAEDHRGGQGTEENRLLTPSPSLSPQRRDEPVDEVLRAEGPFGSIQSMAEDEFYDTIIVQTDPEPEPEPRPEPTVRFEENLENPPTRRPRQPKPLPEPSDRALRATDRTDYRKLHNGLTLRASVYREQDEFGKEEQHYVFTTLRATQELVEGVIAIPKTWRQAKQRPDYAARWKPA